LQENYVRFLRSAYSSRAHALGWMPRQDEDAETRLLRNQVVFLVASRGEDPALAGEARELALRWLADPRALPPDIVSPVLASAAYGGDHDLFERYLKAARATESRTDRLRLYSALGSFADPEIAREAMNLVLRDEFDIRESLGILMATQATPVTRRMRFDFVKQHFDDLIKRLPAEGGFQLGARLPASVGNVFCSEEAAKELDAFFGPRMKNFNGGDQTLAETLENIRLCSALKEKQQASVAEFLRGY
jgi:alanyl aminopeptidase